MKNLEFTKAMSLSKIITFFIEFPIIETLISFQFFDRFTDLLTIDKELGRQLRGKKMAVLSCSTGENLESHFWLPFSETAKYLGMEYIANLHTIAGENNESKIRGFIKRIEK